MFRIHFEAGGRALADYGLKHNVISKLNYKHSANTVDLLEKIASRDDKAQAIKDELFTLKQTVIAEKTAEIEAALKVSPGDGILVKEFDGLKTDDLLQIGRPFTSKDGMEKLLMLIAPRENNLLLFSNSKKYDCGKLVKENASIYNGKGGGNQASARVFFPSREYLDTYIDLVEKHLR
jgi:alanyl-tRNA synthetase